MILPSGVHVDDRQPVSTLAAASSSLLKMPLLMLHHVLHPILSLLKRMKKD